MNATRVINLSVDGNGYPIINGSNRVIKINNSFYIALKSPERAFGCWCEFPFATIYLDEFGEWLVAAADESDLDIIGSGESLDDFVDDTPQNWSCYKGNNVNNVNGEPPTPVLDNLSVSKGILAALEYIPFEVGVFSFIGMKATVSSGCGTLMRPEQIEQTTQWYGVEPEVQSLSAASPPIKPR